MSIATFYNIQSTTFPIQKGSSLEQFPIRAPNSLDELNHNNSQISTKDILRMQLRHIRHIWYKHINSIASL